MAIDPQLTAFMPHTVTIQSVSSTNNYGEPTFGTARTADAYVEPNTTLTATDEVDETHKPTTAYISDTTITIDDKITLPDGTTPEIASIEIHNVVLGLEHTIVRFR